MYLNLLLVFFLSGLWHGAGFHFLVWGMMHGVLYAATRFWQRHVKPGRDGRVEKTEQVGEAAGNKIMTILSQIATFLYVSIAWVYFRAADIGQADRLLMTAFRGELRKPSQGLAECFRVDEFWYVLKVLHLDSLPASPYILMFAVLAAGLYFSMIGKNAAERTARLRYRAGEAAALTVLMVWCILSFSGVSTFLYFNF